MSGSLCRPLCVTKEIQFTQCLGHGVKAHVLQAEWRGRSVVLKSTKPIRESVFATYFINETDQREMTKLQFIRDVSFFAKCQNFQSTYMNCLVLSSTSSSSCSSSAGQYLSVPEPGWPEECPPHWLCAGDHLL